MPQKVYSTAEQIPHVRLIGVEERLVVTVHVLGPVAATMQGMVPQGKTLTHQVRYTSYVWTPASAWSVSMCQA